MEPVGRATGLQKFKFRGINLRKEQFWLTNPAGIGTSRRQMTILSISLCIFFYLDSILILIGAKSVTDSVRFCKLS